MSSGWNHSVFLSKHGLLTIGLNDYGQRGLEEEVSTDFVSFLTRDSFIDIDAGLRHTIAVSSTNQCFIWGNSKKPSSHQTLPTSEIKITNEKFKLCSVGRNSFLLATLNDELIYCEFNKPHVRLLNSEFLNDPIRQVTSGWSHCLILTEHGRVYSFGKNNFYQLGLGNNNSYPLTQINLIKFFPDNNLRVIEISTKSLHSMALTSCGKLFIWGWNEHGMCGMSKEASLNDCIVQPTEIPFFSDLIVEKISAGYGQSAAFARYERNML